jgi:peptidyl-prolyl cis-trans isomerase C
MTHRTITLTFAMLAVALLAGCGSKDNPSADAHGAIINPPPGPLVASVNGEGVTEPMLLTYARGRGLDPAVPAQRTQALDGLVENILLAQDGIARGITQRPEVQAELTLVHVQQLSGRALADYRAQIDITDAQVEQYYRQEAERAGDTEWRIEHILFADAASAQLAIEKALEPGANFAALMEGYATTALQARELGWSNATQLPAELVNALRQLGDGEVAPVPVSSQHGFHVLRRAESRSFVPPPLEQVRDGARRTLIERALAEHVAGLKARATVATGAGG